ncbi:nucleotide exchange factor GrpE [Prochlorothrix hollandica]|uniref:nucleotide exchange factor GrpE n=1 Tax=Prochlorothrix hollandica TaxID=1223 RepID=UPI0003493509|nr:nucleotide exchange factor GrpE [Prochlorothrix hollandica]
MPPSARDLAAQKIQIKKDQERLFRDFLDVLDALDQACNHWQQAEEAHLKTFTAVDVRSPRSRLTLKNWLRGVWAALRGRSPHKLHPSPGETALKQQMAEVLTSAKVGTGVIQRSLLAALQRQEVTPLTVLHQPFDPSQMLALGREVRSDVPPNTVIQEVVRGYCWRDRILREAQVRVAVAPREETVEETVEQTAENPSESLFEDPSNP